MSSSTEEIKARLSVSDVISSYVKLERAGSNFKARCPFHNERTPSFFVSPGRGTYYCFGCGAKGDIFSFVEQFEGLDFTGALKLLATRAGVELRPEDPKKKSERERLFALMEEAAKFFEGNLGRNETARAYLRKRGLEDKTIGAWRLGYAPDTWEESGKYLRGKGFTERELLAAGITKESEKKKGESYDRFRGRIMFPLFDSSGRVIAFSGRLFPGKEGDEAPKYLNSPETSIFHKSHVLYGFDRAKFAIRKYNFSLVVEGQMDLLMSHQAGFGNTVALSGTALTREQLELLRRLSDNILFAYDGDNAGVAATGKGAMIALSLRMNVKVAHFPRKLDPADLLKEDKEEFKKAVREGKHVVDFYLDILEKEGYDERKFRLVVQGIVFPFLAAIDNRIDQAHFISKVASRIHLSEEPVRDEVEKLRKSLAVQNPVEGPALSKDTPVEPRSAALNALLGIILWQKKEEGKRADPKVLEGKLQEIFGERLEPYAKRAEMQGEELVFQAEALFGPSEDLDRDIKDLLVRLEEEELRTRLEELLNKLRVSEAKGEEGISQELLSESKIVSDKLMKISRDTF